MSSYREVAKEACGEYLHRYHYIKVDDTYWPDLPLTGEAVSMSGTDLYRLLLWLEDFFKINLPAELIRREGFRTVNQIAEIVAAVLEVKDEKSSCL